MRSMLNEADGCGDGGERVRRFISSTTSKGGGRESDPSES